MSQKTRNICKMSRGEINIAKIQKTKMSRGTDLFQSVIWQIRTF